MLPIMHACFQQLLSGYTTDSNRIGELWKEIEMHYLDQNRYYHTLAHLEYMYQQLVACRECIEDWDTILFSLFYHDIIYNPLRPDNEEQSATLAMHHLQALFYPKHKIDRCRIQILATKKHQQQVDADANYFTDADLSVLGSSRDTYAQYAANVRKEYAVYPDPIYKPGRVNVLQHFLKMERIYKTPYFFERFEAQARQNLETELQQLC